MKPEYLECEDCGRELIELSDAQAQKVADNPYNYVVYCKICLPYRLEERNDSATW